MKTVRGAMQSDALRLDFVLQPGDIQLLSNFVMLHTRTQYEDYPVRRPSYPQGALYGHDPASRQCYVSR